ncbi:MAG: hypothetical protein HY736_26110 [Verrucomicrobia bacterium]|nr:hypothetical protein [Verrucomicrobiota bacterium]
MNYHDAVTDVLEKAGRIILPGQAVDVVAAAEQEFARHGTCDARFLEPIERMLSECLQQWTVVQKRAIWRSTEAGQADDIDFDESELPWIDVHLEGELMHHIIDRLSGKGAGDNNAERDQEPW